MGDEADTRWYFLIWPELHEGLGKSTWVRRRSNVPCFTYRNCVVVSVDIYRMSCAGTNILQLFCLWISIVEQFTTDITAFECTETDGLMPFSVSPFRTVARSRRQLRGIGQLRSKSSYTNTTNKLLRPSIVPDSETLDWSHRQISTSHILWGDILAILAKEFQNGQTCVSISHVCFVHTTQRIKDVLHFFSA